ncbi:NACHT domain-containing protein [Streptomyces parvus]|uniref:NACHT domain-containing protein n=1 Tax=Streptomyces parvus TaxID=66428 RepID=UPI0033C02018
MSATREPSGRQALAERLGRLHGELRQQGKTQKDAVEEANRRLRTADGRPQDVRSPRRTGGVDLSVTAVNDWFPKQKGAKEPSVPRDFEDLWAVVAVMLKWTGQLGNKSSEIGFRRSWSELFKAAQQATGLDEEVRGYLEAAWKAAEQHPYPGVPGQVSPPSLAAVYVRQRSRLAAQDGHTTSRKGSATGPGEKSGAAPVKAAEAVFHALDRVCVLVAGPGVGKSTLLRTRLRDAASEWLHGRPPIGKSPLAVPVWISARALAGEETQVPDALAAATRKLSRYGRHPELPKARFLERPCAGAHWQVLVDGLDELPDAEERRAVLQKLANAAAQDPPLYRCVVATRPLAQAELDVLDRATPHYELQPFTTDDLHAYVDKYFSTRWPQEEATRRAQQFTGALRGTSLTELSRTPLMAFMLCQLYFAQPERPLPNGRGAVYEAFTDLLYENNQSKLVGNSHEEAIQRLVESLQSPRARRETEAAAQQVLEQLPELINYLAYRRITGHQAPATELLASDEAVHRPAKVRPERWRAYLDDLLRHTGLLTHHADGLDFPHQTFIEYHAAQHATRNVQAREACLDAVFPPGQAYRVRDTEPSYLGFLLDALLASSAAAETTHRIEVLTRQAGGLACRFLVEQVALRTGLPTASTAQQLRRFAQDAQIQYHHDSDRVLAAVGLAGVEGYQEEGATRLTAFANDTALDSYARSLAADRLVGVPGYGDRAAQLLDQLATDTTLHSRHRLRASMGVAKVPGYGDRAAQLLDQLATDTTLNGWERVEAANHLTGVPGYKERAIQLLDQLANDTTLHGYARAEAAASLIEVEGHRDRATYLLNQLARDLTGLEEYRDVGIALLANLADPDHTALDSYARVQAARDLTEVSGYREYAAELLDQLANDTALDGYARVLAARDLTEVQGHRDRAVQLLEQLANDTALDSSARVQAARHLTEVQGHRGHAAQLLNQFARDLIELEGHRDEGAALLIALADHTTLDGYARVLAARDLTGVQGHRGHAAQLLNQFARDLIELEGHRDEGAALLIALADHTTLDGYARVQAARDLAGVQGYLGEAVQLLTRLAGDTTLDDSDRMQAAVILATIRDDGAR